jgi:hypothetical protein
MFLGVYIMNVQKAFSQIKQFFNIIVVWGLKYFHYSICLQKDFRGLRHRYKCLYVLFS